MDIQHKRREKKSEENYVFTCETNISFSFLLRFGLHILLYQDMN